MQADLSRYSIFALVLILFSAVPILHAQEPAGSIRGRVFDAATGEALVGASVTLPGTSLGAAADLDGNFEIRGIPPGTYRVQASVVGHKPSVLTDVVVASGRQTQVTFPLQILPVDLDAVIVEAEYFRKDADEPVSAQSLSYEEIRRAPGGLEDVIRAISVLPGVVQVSAGRNDLIVRGGAASENLYIIDNIEVPNINHFGTQGATGGPLSFVNLDFVNDITFSTGGFGARYGDKLSSVLSIQLKDGRNDRIGGKANISASQFGLNAEGPLGDRGSFLFSARRSYLDFIFKAAGFGFVPEYWDFLGKATYSIDSKNELSFFTISALDDVRFFNDTEEQRYGNSRVLGNSQDQYVSSFSWRHLMEKGFVTLALGRSFVSYDYLQTDSLLNPVFESVSKEGETGLRADGVFLPARDLEISFGAQAKMIRVEGSLATSMNPYFPMAVLPNTAWDTTGAKASAYAQISHLLLESVQLVAGARVDYFSLIDDKIAFSPRLALSYAVTPLTSVSVSAGIYHQAPSLIWLVSNPLNRSLKHLQVTQLILGVEQMLQADTKLRIEGYMKSYSDYPANTLRPYLVQANTGAGFGGAEEGFASFGFDPLVSAGKGESRGVEVLLQKRLSDVPWYGTLSLSYGESNFTAIDGVERAGSYDQRIIANLSGGYRFDDNWEAALKFRFGTGAPYTPFSPDGSIDPALYNTERLPVFHSLDIRVDRRWNFSGWNLVTYIDVQNVYNRKNIQTARFDYRNKRTQLGSGTIGILPTIGVSAEF